MAMKKFYCDRQSKHLSQTFFNVWNKVYRESLVYGHHVTRWEEFGLRKNVCVVDFVINVVKFSEIEEVSKNKLLINSHLLQKRFVAKIILKNVSFEGFKALHAIIEYHRNISLFHQPAKRCLKWKECKNF